MEKFTIDWLMRARRKLDDDVTISFTPKPQVREEAVTSVEGAPSATDIPM